MTTSAPDCTTTVSSGSTSPAEMPAASAAEARDRAPGGINPRHPALNDEPARDASSLPKADRATVYRSAHPESPFAIYRADLFFHHNGETGKDSWTDRVSAATRYDTEAEAQKVCDSLNGETPADVARDVLKADPIPGVTILGNGRAVPLAERVAAADKAIEDAGLGRLLAALKPAVELHEQITGQRRSTDAERVRKALRNFRDAVAEALHDLDDALNT